MGGHLNWRAFLIIFFLARIFFGTETATIPFPFSNQFKGLMLGRNHQKTTKLVVFFERIRIHSVAIYNHFCAFYSPSYSMPLTHVARADDDSFESTQEVSYAGFDRSVRSLYPLR